MSRIRMICATVGLLIGMAACDKPAPAEIEAADTVAPARALTEAEAAVLTAFTDGIERIAPVLITEAETSSLQQQLSETAALLAGAQIQSAQARVSGLRAALANLERSGADAAELDALRLALDALQQITITN